MPASMMTRHMARPLCASPFCVNLSMTAGSFKKMVASSCVICGGTVYYKRGQMRPRCQEKFFENFLFCAMKPGRKPSI